MPLELIAPDQPCREIAPGKSGDYCFRAFQLRAGVVTPTFHDHVPRNRISGDRAKETLRTIVALAGNWTAGYALHSQLNDLGKDPEHYPRTLIRVTQEALRTTRSVCSSGDDWAWYDARHAEE